MHQINIEEAKSNLPDLRDAAIKGEEIVIARDDQHVVKLVPNSRAKPRPQFGSAKGMISISNDFNEPLEDSAENQRRAQGGFETCLRFSLPLLRLCVKFFGCPPCGLPASRLSKLTFAWIKPRGLTIRYWCGARSGCVWRRRWRHRLRSKFIELRFAKSVLKGFAELDRIDMLILNNHVNPVN